ncbi:MAG TPA: hypothetical protein VG297_03495 [Bryobacteraceae bacterium]|nr:hypothetical protein [Bryobacteraceae bacterium]
MSRWRTRLALTGLFLAACGPPPAAQKAQPKDETKEPWYAQSVDELAAANRRASDLLKRGKEDEASTLVQSGEKVAAHLLAVPRPTLRAMEAASDVDELYGRMLLANRNYGWARLFFQKNLSRWKRWTPETADIVSRRNAAAAEIAECDRRMGE